MASCSRVRLQSRHCDVKSAHFTATIEKENNVHVRKKPAILFLLT